MKKNILEYARTNLITAPDDSNIQDIARIMKEELVGSVFLIDDSEKMLGIVTDKSIFDLIVEGKNPLEVKPIDIIEKIDTVHKNTSALEVLEKMKNKGYTRIGVSDDKGRLIGIVSRKKLQFEQIRILKEELGIQV